MRLRLILPIFLRSFSVVSAFGIFLMSSFFYGPEGRGVISFSTSLFIILSLFGTFGLGRVFYQEISQNSHLLKMYLQVAYRQIVSFSVLTALLLFAVVFFGADFISEGMYSRLKYSLFLVGSLPFYMWQNYAVYFYSSTKNIVVQDRVIFFGRLGLLIALSLVALSGVGINAFLIWYSVGSVIVVIYEVLSLMFLSQKQKGVDLFESIKILYGLVMRSGWAFLDSIAQSMMIPASTFLLGFFVTSDRLGYFNFSMQMLTALLFPFTVIQSRVQEKLTDHSNVYRDFQSFLRDVLLFSIPLVLGGAIIPIVLPAVGLKSFMVSGEVLYWLLPLIPLMGISYLFQSLWIGLHKAKYSSILNLITGGINAIVVVMVSKLIGIYAGVLALFCANLVGVVIQFYHIKRYKVT